MEDVIELAVVDLLNEALVDTQSDNWPTHIERYLDDYDQSEDYPVIVVNVSEEQEESLQIQAYTTLYTLHVIIVCVDDNYADAVTQRSLLKQRILSAFRGNMSLNHVTSTSTNEKVQYTRYRGTEYSIGGFADDWQTLAQIEYEVLTETLGPF